MWLILLVVLVGVFAQLVDGTLGMGFGVTSNTFILSLGVSASLASASVHTAEIFTTCASGLSHIKMGNTDKKIFVPLCTFGIVGGVLGAIVLVLLSLTYGKVISAVVGLILLVMGCIILTRFIRNKLMQVKKPLHDSKPKLATLGFFGAMLDAIGGGGWGPVCTTTLVVNGTAPNKAVGSVNLAEFFVTIAMTITFIILIGYENFRWDIVIPLALAGVCVSPFSAYLCKKLSARVLGVAVGILIIILSLRMVLKAFGLFR